MAVNALPKHCVLSGMISMVSLLCLCYVFVMEVNLNDAIGTMVNNNTVVVDGEIIYRVSEDSTLEKTRPRQ